MTTQSDVRSAWNSKIWSNSSITALTPKIYNYDPTKQSTKEVSKLFHNQEINFFTYLVTRAQQLKIMQQVEQVFTVNLSYYKVADTEGVAYNQVLDAFETIDSLVASQLGTTWDGVVDFYQMQEEPVSIAEINLLDVSVWVGQYKYFGFKNL